MDRPDSGAKTEADHDKNPTGYIGNSDLVSSSSTKSGYTGNSDRVSSSSPMSGYTGNSDLVSSSSTKSGYTGNSDRVSSSSPMSGYEFHRSNKLDDSFNGTEASHATDDEEDDDYKYLYNFEMTDDQRKATGELYNLKLDLGYTEKEQGPDYDVSEKVRQLNEELARDPAPAVDEREHHIKFKENLVDFVAPTPDLNSYDIDLDEPNAMAEEDDKEVNKKAELEEDKSKGDNYKYSKADDKIDDSKKTVVSKRSDEPGKAKRAKIDEKISKEEKIYRMDDSAGNSDHHGSSSNSDSYGLERSQSRVGDDAKESSIIDDGDSEDGSNSSSSDGKAKTDAKDRKVKSDEQILIERNGEFQLVSLDQLTPEERDLYVVKDDAKDGEGQTRFEPRPPSTPRASSGRNRGNGKSETATNAEEADRKKKKVPTATLR